MPATRFSIQPTLNTPWRDAGVRALTSGAAASVASTVALVLSGWRELDHPAQPTNSISHWAWGEQALDQTELSVRHTLLGYVVHHSAAIFWAVFFERARGWRSDRRSSVDALIDAVCTAAAAYFIDVHLTPKRLTPGFERRLSGGALFLVYTAFAAGLFLADRLRDAREERPQRMRRTYLD